MPLPRRISYALSTTLLALTGAVTLTAPGGAGARAAAVTDATPTITEVAVPTAGVAPLQITTSTSKQLFFTEAGAAALGVRTQAGTIEQITGLSEPASGITAGPADTVWFTEAGGAGAIGRITPTGTITQFTTGLTPNSAPTAITTGPDGNLWFTEAGGAGAIGRITPTGTITEFRTGLTPNSAPTAITSLHGDLWFTENAAPGRLGTVSFPPANAPGANGSHGTSATAPTAVTDAPRRIGARTATVAALVTAAGHGTTYHFEWGTTTAYGHRVPGADASVGSGNGRHVLVKTLTGLSPDTVYHYRVVATDCGGCQAGTSAGADMTFETLSSGSAQDLAAHGLTPPAIGRSALVGLASGTVLVRRRGAARSVALTRNGDIPTGSLIDAAHGSLVITTSLGTHGRLQSATVWGGTFLVHQSRARGMTTFTLAGPLACASHAHAHAVRAAVMTAMFRRAGRPRRTRRPRRFTRRRRRPVRSLWARDNHGQYSTRGQNSVTTVRGTWWETVDTCAGTRTFVKRGLVSVRDLRRHRTVLVRAGHSYLARP